MKSIVFLFLLFLPIFVNTACGERASEGEDGQRSSFIFVDSKTRGWLGVSIDDVDPDFARRKGLNVEEGAYVNSVVEESPAQKADIRKGDVITEYDGKKISDSRDLIDEVRRTKPETEVMISLRRGDERKGVKVTIGKSPREPRLFSFNVPRSPRIRVQPPDISILRTSGLYGMSVEELNRQLGEYFGAPDGKGLLVKNVKRDSEAEKAGFKAGDVIVKVGKETIHDVDDLLYALDEYKDGDKADVEVLRKGNAQKLTLTVSARQRDLSLHLFEGDHDFLFDIFPGDENEWFHDEKERLKHELNDLKDTFREEAIQLKHQLKNELNKIRRSVNV